MSDPARVVAFINGPECEIEAQVAADSSLIKSGLLDSLALFQLSVWIEEQVGGPLILDDIEISEAWDTPADIARYIDAMRDTAK